jgi:cephalosporin-C deacetylase-like acetyl esterase
MSAAELDLYQETETERIQRWRTDELERAGYDESDAAELAGRADVDLHLAVELLERGCPPSTALRILL